MIYRFHGLTDCSSSIFRITAFSCSSSSSTSSSLITGPSLTLSSFASSMWSGSCLSFLALSRKLIEASSLSISAEQLSSLTCSFKSTSSSLSLLTRTSQRPSFVKSSSSSRQLTTRSRPFHLELRPVLNRSRMSSVCSVSCLK